MKHEKNEVNGKYMKLMKIKSITTENK